MIKEPKTEIREKFLSAANKLLAAVGATLGPGGKLVAIQSGDRKGTFTKDGVSVARAIELADPIENICAQAIIEASMNSNIKAGDGTTTTVVLCCKIIEVLSERDIDLNEFQKQAARARALLKEQSKKATPELIRAVAAISSNNDSVIIDLVCKAFTSVGAEGLIRVEETSNTECKLVLNDGFESKQHGWAHRGFCTEGVRAIAKNPLVLVTGVTLATNHQFHQLAKVMEHAMAENKPLVLVAPDFVGDFLHSLLVNHVKGAIKFLPIRAGASQRFLEDFAAVANTTLRDANLGNPLDIAPTELGTLQLLESGPQDLLAMPAHRAGIEAQTKYLQGQLDATPRALDQAEYRNRISALNSRIARLLVGGVSESEMRERKDRFDDAVAAVLAAAKGGVVGGAGQALRAAADAIGYPPLTQVLEAPARLIATNAGRRWEALANMAPHQCWNARTGKIVDPFQALIVDPLLVVETALDSALAITNILLNTAAVVIA